MIGIYKNNPTAGLTDGTAVSQDGSQSAPVSVTLDAGKAESQIIPLAIRCDSGYQTTGETVISFSGDNASKWSICATEDGTFSNSLSMLQIIGNANIIFYVKCTSATTDAPQRDISTSITVTATLVAV